MKQAITVKNIMEKIDEIKAVQDGLRDISVDESENEAALENAMDIMDEHIALLLRMEVKPLPGEDY